MIPVKKYSKSDGHSYALGATVCIELLKNRPDYVRGVFFHSELSQSDAKDLAERICRDNEIPVETNDKVFRILSQKENCYMIAVFEKYPETVSAERPHIVLVQPSNAGNLGTIIRSAAGFNVPDLILIRPSADIFDPKVVRASMGAVFIIRHRYFDTFEAYAKVFPDKVFYPFMLDGSMDIRETVFNNNFSLVFGNEATGLPPEFAEIGHPVRISHLSCIDSLNLPVAVGIGLYEAFGQIRNLWKPSL
jgi:TrmH family RNA methyltransferase